jgi:hypothetical protein
MHQSKDQIMSRVYSFHQTNCIPMHLSKDQIM